MSQSIISAGTQLAAGRSHSILNPTKPTFNSIPHTLTFTTHTGNSSLRRSRRRPINPIRASAAPTADAAAESSGLYVTTAESLYDLLGIPATVTGPEIKQAYRKLARKYHPDVSPPGKTEEYTNRFLRVQEAYETLSDPRSRAEYDREFSGGKGMDGRGEWRQRWESQVEELQRMQQWKQSNQSWGDRMRSRRSCDFSFN